MQSLILPLTLNINIDNIGDMTKFVYFRTAVFLLSVCFVFIINSYRKEPIHAIVKEFKSMAIQNSRSTVNTWMCVSVVLG